jgi:Arc/MetJ-type ribon-helix-helix transcriptional regulator
MPRPKLIKGNKKDHKVTIRLDNDTYRSLKEAIEQGKVTNLSEALRGMIRQKVWEVKFSEEIRRDLRLNEVSEKDLREMVDRLLGDFDTAENREFVKLDGFLEALFSSIGSVIRKALVELERREAGKRTSEN